MLSRFWARCVGLLLQIPREHGFVVAAVVQYGHRTDDDFLGCQSAGQTDSDPPVKAERSDSRLDEMPDPTDVRFFLMLGVLEVVEVLYLRLFLLGALVRGGDQRFLGCVVGRVLDVSRVVSQRPNDDRGKQDHGSHFLQVLRAFVPHMPYDVARGRDAVGRKFHDERSLLLSEQQFLEQNGRKYGDQDADQVDRE